MEKKAKFHHSAFKRGYVPMRMDGQREEYCGKFGVGYIIHNANLRKGLNGKMSNNYHVIDYYIYEND